jgi:hypothetical protein
MTEAEWRASDDPKDMLTQVGIGPQRKLRLFACACCRRIWHLITDERCRNAVEVAERYADGLVKERERAKANRQASKVSEEIEAAAQTEWEVLSRSASFQAAAYAVELSGQVAWNGAGWAAAAVGFVAMNGNPRATARERMARRREESAQCNLLRDIFGNPFRPAAIGGRHVTPKITKLAETIYDRRAFDRLPVLADALDDAGCDEADVLAHCRGPGPHVRGCWVVDLVLGKV